MLNEGYKENEEPVFKDINYVINFDVPEHYSRYKQTATMIEHLEGAVINLVSKDNSAFELIPKF